LSFGVCSKQVVALKKFLKFNASSLIATAIDYSVFFILYKELGIWYMLAAFIGVVVGGITNFAINRNFVFQDKSASGKQALKYFVVWLLNLSLNLSGIYFLKEVIELDPTWAKVIVSVVVGSFFSFVAQKKFVFN